MKKKWKKLTVYFLLLLTWSGNTLSCRDGSIGSAIGSGGLLVCSLSSPANSLFRCGVNFITVLCFSLEQPKESHEQESQRLCFGTQCEESALISSLRTHESYHIRECIVKIAGYKKSLCVAECHPDSTSGYLEANLIVSARQMVFREAGDLWWTWSQYVWGSGMSLEPKFACLWVKARLQDFWLKTKISVGSWLWAWQNSRCTQPTSAAKAKTSKGWAKVDDVSFLKASKRI